MIRHKRALLLFTVPALILLALTVSEGSSAPSPVTTDIASRSSASVTERYQALFETPTTATGVVTVTPAAARLLPGGAGLSFGVGRSSASVAPAARFGGASLSTPTAPASATGVTAPAPTLAAAEQTAAGAVKQVQVAVQQARAAADSVAFAEAAPGSGVAAALPPSSFARICSSLLAAKARSNAQINALEARFPFLTARLEVARAQANAQVNAQLARFGCSVIS